MPDEIPLYQLLKQRIAEHAEADFARATASVTKKPDTPHKETASLRWLRSFEKRHGLSYGVYRGMVKRGEIPRLKTPMDWLGKPKTPIESPVTA